MNAPFLSASGTANLDGDIAASVDASNIPLALLGTAFPAAGARILRAPAARDQRPVGQRLRADPLAQSGRLDQPVQPRRRDAGRTGAPTYALDRIRSGAITLASATPGGPKVLTVNDLAAFKDGRLVATLSGTLPVPLGDLMKPDAGRPDSRGSRTTCMPT